MSDPRTRTPNLQTDASQKRDTSLSRFHVTALASDRDLIRALAKRLAEGGPDASRLRAAITQAMTGAPRQKGGILAALRRSPLVGGGYRLEPQSIEQPPAPQTRSSA